MGIERLKAASRAAGFAMVAADDACERVVRSVTKPVVSKPTTTRVYPSKTIEAVKTRWQITDWFSGLGWRPTG
ncbi:MAG: hypothetical protein AAF732_20010 [Pseudomonadota bacterium]